MLRALSTRRNHDGYEKLGDEEADLGLVGGKLKRVTSVPASFYGPPIKAKQSEQSSQVKKKPPAKTTGTVHPLLSFFDISFQGKKNKKKKKTKNATAKPEVARYMQYLKEGGVWDASSNTPVIYHR